MLLTSVRCVQGRLVLCGNNRSRHRSGASSAPALTGFSLGGVPTPEIAARVYLPEGIELAAATSVKWGDRSITAQIHIEESRDTTVLQHCGGRSLSKVYNGASTLPLIHLKWRKSFESPGISRYLGRSGRNQNENGWRHLSFPVVSMHLRAVTLTRVSLKPIFRWATERSVSMWRRACACSQRFAAGL